MILDEREAAKSLLYGRWKTSPLPQGRIYFSTIEIIFDEQGVESIFDLFFDKECTDHLFTSRYLSTYELLDAHADTLVLMIAEIRETLLLHSLKAADYFCDLQVYERNDWKVGVEEVINEHKDTKKTQHTIRFATDRLLFQQAGGAGGDNYIEFEKLA